MGNSLWHPAICQSGSWMSELEQGLGSSISRSKFFPLMEGEGRYYGVVLTISRRHFPQVDVLGTDLSPIQPAGVVPENCQFEVGDAELDWIWPVVGIPGPSWYR